jgi:TIR domain
MSTPIVFISYSQADKSWRDRLVRHLSVLEQQRLLRVFYDERIDTGRDWNQEIQTAMDEARLAILLISCNFLVSDFILKEEVPRLLERREKDGTVLMPVLLSECPWQTVDWLKRMQFFRYSDEALEGQEESQINRYLASLAKRVHQVLDPGQHTRLPPKGEIESRTPGERIAPPEKPPGTVTEVARGTEADGAHENRMADIKLRLLEKLEALADEGIDVHGKKKPVLQFVLEILGGDLVTEQGRPAERLSAFLMEPCQVTLPRLVKAHRAICDRGHKETAKRIGEIIDIVTPLQIPQHLWDRVREQLNSRRAVLEGAAGGLLCAEAITARLEGKHVTITEGSDGKPLPANMIGRFPAENTPIGSPEGNRDLVLKDLYLSHHVPVGGALAASPRAQEMAKELQGVLRALRDINDRVPYLVVKLPEDSNNRAHWINVLAGVTEAVEHLIVVELSIDPDALALEGVLFSCLNTRFNSERKWKTP